MIDNVLPSITTTLNANFNKINQKMCRNVKTLFTPTQQLIVQLINVDVSMCACVLDCMFIVHAQQRNLNRLFVLSKLDTLCMNATTQHKKPDAALISLSAILVVY